MDGIGRRADPIRIAFAPVLGCDLVPLPRTNPFPGRIPATRFRLNALDKLIGFDTVPGRIHHHIHAAFRPENFWRAGLDTFFDVLVFQFNRDVGNQIVSPGYILVHRVNYHCSLSIHFAFAVGLLAARH